MSRFELLKTGDSKEIKGVISTSRLRMWKTVCGQKIAIRTESCSTVTPLSVAREEDIKDGF